eukprot:1160002-Pelagomonas_calceolata.AAC.16
MSSCEFHTRQHVDAYNAYNDVIMQTPHMAVGRYNTYCDVELQIPNVAAGRYNACRNVIMQIPHISAEGAEGGALTALQQPQMSARKPMYYSIIIGLVLLPPVHRINIPQASCMALFCCLHLTESTYLKHHVWPCFVETTSQNQHTSSIMYGLVLLPPPHRINLPQASCMALSCCLHFTESTYLKHHVWPCLVASQVYWHASLIRLPVSGAELHLNFLLASNLPLRLQAEDQSDFTTHTQ